MLNKTMSMGKLEFVSRATKSDIPVTPPSIKLFGSMNPFKPSAADNIPKLISKKSITMFFLNTILWYFLGDIKVLRVPIINQITAAKNRQCCLIFDLIIRFPPYLCISKLNNHVVHLSISRKYWYR